MAKWRVYSINNARHEVVLQSDKGEFVHIVVPEEYRDSHELKQYYIKSVHDKHDKRKKRVNIGLYTFFGTLSVSVVMTILKVFHVF